MPTVRVQTTQNVSLEYEVASLGDRILATLVDYLLYAVWFIFAAVLTNGLDLEKYVGFVLALTPTTFYHLACEIYFNGQSLGKRVRSTRVMRLDGTRPSLGDYALRWLLRPLEVLGFYGAPALLTILINGKGQRLGDLAAGTTVISLKARPEQGSLLQAAPIMPPGYSYQPIFRQAAQLADHDAALLRQLLSRGVAQQNFVLLNEAATKIKAILGVQSDLGDELFLRTVLLDHAHLLSEESGGR